METRLDNRTPTRRELVRLARRQFLRGQKLEIQSLATELGVSRATAYRWAGNADRLAGEVIADLAEETFKRAVSETGGRGPERVVAAMERGMRYIVASEPYRTFLERDPAKALRIAASSEGPAQGRMIALHQQLLAEEIDRGTLHLPVDAHTMAYALVRVAESFMYADVIAGEAPDIDAAVEIVRVLLT